MAQENSTFPTRNRRPLISRIPVPQSSEQTKPALPFSRCRTVRTSETPKRPAACAGLKQGPRRPATGEPYLRTTGKGKESPTLLAPG